MLQFSIHRMRQGGCIANRHKATVASVIEYFAWAMWTIGGYHWNSQGQSLQQNIRITFPAGRENVQRSVCQHTMRIVHRAREQDTIRQPEISYLVFQVRVLLAFPNNDEAMAAAQCAGCVRAQQGGEIFRFGQAPQRNHVRSVVLQHWWQADSRELPQPLDMHRIAYDMDTVIRKTQPTQILRNPR